jgi:NTE family protein/lysophospholipid hydrolase
MAREFAFEGPLVDALRSVEGIGALPQEVLDELAAEMSVVTLADGDSLVREHDTGVPLGAVLSGVLSVTWVDRHGATRTLPDIRPGGTFGEVSVVSNTPALATLRARGPVRLVQLSAAGFDRFAQRSPVGALALIDALRPQLQRHAFRFTLHHTDTFRDLDPQLLTSLEAELEPVSIYSGETLLREGEDGDSIYIVISGRLRVVRRSPKGEELVLAEVGSGETIGEMALITGESRSADVYAIRDTQLARLSKPAVERLLARHPMSALVMLARGPVSRVRNMSSGRSQVAPISTIAIVPASPDVPLTAFGARLSTGLSRLGSTLHVSSELVDRQFGRPGAAQAYDRHGAGARLLEWLAEQELEHRFVVYQSDMACTPWTERSIRQADYVVVVANATGDPGRGEIESQLLNGVSGRRIGCTLALVYNDDAMPAGTARWFTGRTLDRHLLVRLEDPSDFERVARHVTGHALGLVLGGGFARGLAHVGVLRALAEFNLPIDALGGSSMGALVGAQHLLGWNHDRIVQDTVTSLARSFDDMTIPFLAFTRGGKYARMLQTFFGDTQIEDMWLPFFCTSSNLNRADLKIHTTGSLAMALLATTRAPGVFPPVVIDGELHVDGGLINNVPVDVMKTFSNQGTVIGVDVSPPHELNRVVDYGDDVSGWHAMWNRFNPTREKRSYRPSILLVLMRLIEFGGISYRVRNAHYADLYIAPEVLQFKRNEFQRAPQIVEAGYSKAQEALAEWLARRDSTRPGPPTWLISSQIMSVFDPPPFSSP